MQHNSVLGVNTAPSSPGALAVGIYQNCKRGCYRPSWEGIRSQCDILKVWVLCGTGGPEIRVEVYFSKLIPTDICFLTKGGSREALFCSVLLMDTWQCGKHTEKTQSMHSLPSPQHDQSPYGERAQGCYAKSHEFKKDFIRPCLGGLSNGEVPFHCPSMALHTPCKPLSALALC